MFKRIGLLSIAVSLNTVSLSLNANTALVFKKNTPAILAMNFDWKYREGAVVIHPRNTLMVASVDYHQMHPLMWKNQYASIIFHGGHKFKAGPGINGMNEKGLTASIFVTGSAGYPNNPEQPTLKTSEWVQYVLDNHQSVQEVIDDLANYQLVPDTYRNVVMNAQLLVNDANGNSALIEFVDGRSVVHTQDTFPAPVVSNSDYRSALALLSDYQEYGGSKELPGGYDSNARFVRAAHFIKRLPSFVAKEERIAYAFNSLSDVAQAPATATPTQLSMVFDISTKTIYFRSINEAGVRVIPLDKIQFNELYEPTSINTYQHFYGDVLDKFQSMYG
ncbi:linear amide C-N hydrolase [Legionella waltersii]|uniref:Choloylglycine hydrolase n=1 Tax=Legionella waltersii TaxID=66969 RepID=A0A0W1AN69_9GAMM|nr:linear amide C-N hydrolase [Legionella waltersii]KTD82793.1 choloylglycine hydrolase [Legionella waltersii]SNV01381.1 choloylglycine hydrolase [Legionella waltersii]